MGDSPERSKVYDWARRNSLYDPYDFALNYEEYHDDPGTLVHKARAWDHRHLTERRAQLEEEKADLDSRIQIIDNDLARNETKWGDV